MLKQNYILCHVTLKLNNCNKDKTNSKTLLLEEGEKTVLSFPLKILSPQDQWQCGDLMKFEPIPVYHLILGILLPFPDEIGDQNLYLVSFKQSSLKQTTFWMSRLHKN